MLFTCGVAALRVLDCYQVCRPAADPMQRVTHGPALFLFANSWGKHLRNSRHPAQPCPNNPKASTIRTGARFDANWRLFAIFVYMRQSGHSIATATPPRKRVSSIQKLRANIRGECHSSMEERKSPSSQVWILLDTKYTVGKLVSNELSWRKASFQLP
jgi:hypothetical protein